MTYTELMNKIRKKRELFLAMVVRKDYYIEEVDWCVYKYLLRPLRQFIRRVGNCIYWLPVIWLDGWWDSDYLYKIINHKLIHMSSHIRKEGHSIDSEGMAGEIDSVVMVLTKIINNDFLAKEEEVLWAKHPIVMICREPHENGNIPIHMYSSEDGKKLRDELYLKQDKLRKQAFYKVFETLRTRSENWWD